MRKTQMFFTQFTAEATIIQDVSATNINAAITFHLVSIFAVKQF